MVFARGGGGGVKPILNDRDFVGSAGMLFFFCGFRIALGGDIAQRADAPYCMGETTAETLLTSGISKLYPWPSELVVGAGKG